MDTKRKVYNLELQDVWRQNLQFLSESLCNQPKLFDDTPMIHLCMTWHTQRGVTFQSQKEHRGQLVFCAISQEKQLTNFVE